MPKELRESIGHVGRKRATIGGLGMSSGDSATGENESIDSRGGNFRRSALLEISPDLQEREIGAAFGSADCPQLPGGQLTRRGGHGPEGDGGAADRAKKRDELNPWLDCVPFSTTDEGRRGAGVTVMHWFRLVFHAIPVLSGGLRPSKSPIF